MPMSDDIHVHIHLEGLDGIIAAALADRQILREILHNTERLISMSASLADQLTAALADISTAVDGVSTEVSALLALLQGQGGQPVTQTMVDAANSIDARLKAIPPAPAPTPAP